MQNQIALDVPLLQREEESINVKVYGEIRAKIFLEVISAQTATVLLVLTYITFAICFSVDIANTAKAFTDSNSVFQPAACPAINNSSSSNHSGYNSSLAPSASPILVSPFAASFATSDDPHVTYIILPLSAESQSCSSGGLYSWNATVTDLTNVISVQVSVAQTVFTSYTNWTAVEAAAAAGNCVYAPLTFDATLWACFQPGGCTGFASQPDASASVWQRAVSLTSQNVLVNLCSVISRGVNDVVLLPSTFQNQEAIPTNGVIQSYLAQVSFTYNPYRLFVPVTPAVAEGTAYTVAVVNRPSHGALSSFAVVLVTICLVVTLAALASFLRVMWLHEPDPRKWLPEQQWAAGNLFAIAVYLNPIFIAIYWQERPTAAAALVSYIFDQLGQCAFLFVWLLFADPLGCRDPGGGSGASLRALRYYSSKALIPLLILGVYLGIIGLQFPSLGPAANYRNSVEAVVNWPLSTQRALVGLSVLYLALQWLWALLWLLLLLRTGRRLSKLPYMSTRYMQLSFRFFALQATLIALYYVFQYATVIYYIVLGGEDGGVSSSGSSTLSTTQLADNINTMFREQTQLFGKLVFLTVYTLALAALFLPAAWTGEAEGAGTKGIAGKLAAAYVITEEELAAAVRARRRALSKLNRLQRSLLRGVAAYRPQLFCVDLAVALCDLSYEAYYDPPGTVSGSGLGHDPAAPGGLRSLDLARLGYDFLASRTDEAHDTFCCVARHRQSRRLLVVFRGTSSRKHWHDNVNWNLRPLDPLHVPPQCLPVEAFLPGTLGSVSGAVTSVASSGRNTSTETEKAVMGPETGPIDWTGVVSQLELEEEGEEEEEVVAGPETMGRSSSLFNSKGSAGSGSGSGSRRRALPRLAELEPERLMMADGAPSSSEPSLYESRASDRTGSSGSEEGRGSIYFKRTLEGLDDSRAAVASGARALAASVLGGAGTAAGAVTATASAAENAVRSAALQTPGLRQLLAPQVHAGFWDAYAPVREFVHEVVRRQLAAEPADLLLTGHSLGGALATLCAMDLPLHTLPPVNQALRTLYKEQLLDGKNGKTNLYTAPGPVQSPLHGTEESTPFVAPTAVDPPHSVHVTLYTFGCPRVGNRPFAQLVNRAVPDSFRVTVDGDLVPAFPGYGYKHCGTQVLVDGVGASGSLIIAPSFIERRLRVQPKINISAHSLEVYRRGLVAVADAAIYTAQLTHPSPSQSPGGSSASAATSDAIQVALRTRGLIEEKQSEDRKIREAVQGLTGAPAASGSGAQLRAFFTSAPSPAKSAASSELPSRPSSGSLIWATHNGMGNEEEVAAALSSDADTTV